MYDLRRSEESLGWLWEDIDTLFSERLKVTRFCSFYFANILSTKFPIKIILISKGDFNNLNFANKRL